MCENLSIEDGQLARRPRLVSPLQEVNRRDHRGERVAQLVPHDREKFVFHPLGRRDSRELDARLLHLQTVGQVVRDDAEPDQLAAPAPERREDDGRAERRAVFSDPDPLDFGAPFTRRHVGGRLHRLA